MSKVLVTGSEGFVSQYICKELIDNDYYITGIDNQEKYGDKKRIHSNCKLFSLSRFDLRNYPRLDNYFDLLKPNIVICCASKVGGIRTLSSYTDVNILENKIIDLNTITLCKKYEVSHVIYLSTANVYGRFLGVDCKESTPMTPRDINTSYAKYKWETEELLLQYDLPYTIFRLANAAGIGDDNEEGRHVIGDLVHNLKKSSEPCSLYGGGLQIRNFIHGSDIAKYILSAIKEPKLSIKNIFNLGNPNNTTSIKELAHKIQQKMQPHSFHCYEHEKSLPNDIQNNIMNMDKLIRTFGNAKISLDEIIEEAVKYYE